MHRIISKAQTVQIGRLRHDWEESCVGGRVRRQLVSECTEDSAPSDVAKTSATPRAVCVMNLHNINRKVSGYSSHPSLRRRISSQQTLMGFSAEIIEKQASEHLGAVGRGIDTGVLTDHLHLAQDATPTSFFLLKKHIRFWYETVEKGDLHRKGGEVADLWAQVKHSAAPYKPSQADSFVQVEDNIHRAASSVKRPAKPASSNLVLGWVTCRLKQLPATEWEDLPEGPGMDDRPQTVVCIALEDLGPHNGFFLNLSQGEDVCMDGKSQILLPPTGGGLALLVWIHI